MAAMNIVLISTYEVGRQPFGVASPAAWLRKRAHQVACFDLTRQALDDAAIRAADFIGIYLPMHTATRLAAKLIPTLRQANPQAHLCCYGLYAPMNAEYLRSLGVATIIGGEFEAALTRLAERLKAAEARFGAPKSSSLSVETRYPRPRDIAAAAVSRKDEPEISLERLRFEVPDRAGLPALAKYAHLVVPGDGYRVVGSTEASRGCKHLCRHCPIVPVYKGVFRVVDRDVVLEDVRQQVAGGAQHISFGDPDFFNGIRHAMELLEAFHREFPNITYDVTIKIEHLRKYERHLARLRDAGCLFIISAVESVDDGILARLDKGHTREDFLYVARLLRSVGITLHPTFVPFTPWTTMDGYLDLLRVLADEELIENVAPIQLGIRLLIPKGSRLLELQEVRHIVEGFDGESLIYPWKNEDRRVDTLSDTVQAIAADADGKKQSRSETFAEIWEAAHVAAGCEIPALPARSGSAVPFLSEPWYCCAEPTKDQLVSISSLARPKVREAAVGADGFV
jgi:radical SAM superfamily enzyme YgiQ (UPF0313 family)